jgi:hypothetical protein
VRDIPESSTALAPLARTLEEALPGSMVFVNGRGDVISPANARMRQLLGYSSSAAVGAFLVGFCTSLFGWEGAAASSAYLAYGLWNLREGRRAARAWRLIAGNPTQAEAILSPLSRGRWRPSWVRAGAHAALAHLAVLRGDDESALTHYRAALAAYARGANGGRAQARTARHGEIFALVNLGRVGEARATLNALGPLPAGNYLRFQRWSCELYVCFAEGQHAIDADELHQRSRAALRLSSGGALIALCAWAHAHLGDHDQAAHLLAEARERADSAQIARRTPKLDAWMTSYADVGSRTDAADG